MNNKFEYWYGVGGEWYWRLKANNGEILCHSEGYTRKYDCQKGIEACKRAVKSATVKMI